MILATTTSAKKSSDLPYTPVGKVDTGRRVEKKLSIKGQRPTVPTVKDHETEGWKITDIYENEICINTADGLWYTRVGNRIIGPQVSEERLQIVVTTGEGIIEYWPLQEKQIEIETGCSRYMDGKTEVSLPLSLP